jgi:hypothetical protein
VANTFLQKVDMKTRNLSLFPLICLAALSGCATGEKPAGEMPDATISDAYYPPGEVGTIHIKGEFFKMKSDNKSDVVVSLNGQRWKPATKIVESSPTEYIANIPYNAAFPQVWVRVYGMNSKYSDLFLIHVWRY